MTQQEKIEMLEDIMEVEEGTLKPDMVLADIEEWDSLTTLALAVKVRSLYSKNLTADEIKSFITVEDVCNYLD